jgi:hypothetical protein
MALDRPFTARVEKPFTIRVEKPAATLANAMAEMRAWLDNTALKPVDFKIAAAGNANIAFDVTFRTSTEARQFERAFG